MATRLGRTAARFLCGCQAHLLCNSHSGGHVLECYGMCRECVCLPPCRRSDDPARWYKDLAVLQHVFHMDITHICCANHILVGTLSRAMEYEMCVENVFAYLRAEDGITRHDGSRTWPYCSTSSTNSTWIYNQPYAHYDCDQWRKNLSRRRYDNFFLLRGRM